MVSSTKSILTAIAGLLLAQAVFAQMARVTTEVTPTTAPPCVVAPAGLVSWWPGDANENDIIGGNNPFAVQAVTLVPAEVLDGFTFGTEGYIQIPAASNLANQTFTWAAWARPDGPGPNNDAYGSVVFQQDWDTSDGVSLWWSGLDDRFRFAFGNVSSELIASSDAFPTGAFYFLAATYDGSNFQLYVNGVPVGSYAETKTMTYSSNPWMIGSTQPSLINEGYPRTWNGVIDEVQAYNAALSQSEIQAIYTSGSAGECKGLTYSPASLKFPRQAVGTTSAPRAVTATNAFPLAVTVDKVKTSGDFAQTNACSTLAPGATCTVNVTFTPTAPGTQKGKLTIADSAPYSPQKVSLTGSGSDIELSVTRLNLGSRAVGSTSKAKPVTATNVGTALVTFTGSGIVLAGADPGDFVISANTCGPSLASDTNCTVSIEFKPTATGTRTATLEFNDDGGASPQTVALTGNGT